MQGIWININQKENAIVNEEGDNKNIPMKKKYLYEEKSKEKIV